MDRAPGHRSGAARTGRPALTSEPPVNRRTLAAEVWIVFALSLGMAALFAAVDLLADLTAHRALSAQTSVVVGSFTPNRPWIDLAYQLLSLLRGVVPAALALYLLHRSAESAGTIGFDLRRPRSDLVVGALLAAVVGGAGLGIYLIAHAIDANTTVVVSDLPDVWWRIPVLVLSAMQNAVLEEVVVVGYLLHRLRQLGWADNRALALSAGIRGAYHFYQGFGGFAGNAALGLVFGRLYQRWGRVGPLVVAHTFIDAVAFVGYVLLAGHVSWLPSP
jgi:membrane protease YdiL (CAAX protease family)